MIKDSRERELPNDNKEGRGSTGMWPPPFPNSRIVRVSRAFGGKDRHSKVSTLRGLRDRRVRLSMPTAIQLYDLQDKLGLSQPSKVVDWLINAAQHEIDKLPPLQFPPNWASSSVTDAAGNDHEPNQLNRSSSTTSNFLYEPPPLPKTIHQNSEALLPASYRQIEPQDQHSFPTMPPSFSSYLAGTSNFETTRPFAQFPPVNFKQYYIHEDEARRAEGMRGEAAVYEDCGAVHDSNAAAAAADFFL